MLYVRYQPITLGSGGGGGGTPTGTPNTFAGFDAAGLLFSIVGWNFDPTTYGASVDLNYDPDAGATVINRLTVNTDPSNSNSNQVIAFELAAAQDAGDSGNDGGELMTLNVGSDYSGSGTLNILRAFVIDQHSGDGSSTGTISNLNAAEIYSEITSDTTVGSGRGLLVQTANNGTLVNDYAILHTNFNGSAVGNSLTGVDVSLQADANTLTSFNSNIQNNSTQNTYHYNSSSSGVAGQDLLIFNSNNTGAVGNNYYGVALSNNADIGTNLTGVSVNNAGHVLSSLNAFAINNQGDVDANFNGLLVLNSGNLTQGAAAIGANFSGGTLGGNLYGLALTNSMDGSLTDTTIYGANISNSGAANRFSGFDANNSADQQEEIRGFSFNSTGDARTGTGLDISYTGNFTNDINGVRVDMQNATSSDGLNSINALKTTGGKVAHDGSSFSVGSTLDTATSGTLNNPFGLNNLGGTFNIAAGFPITGGLFGIGNNLGIGVVFDDDMPPDGTGIGLGFVMNGFLTQLAPGTGKTMDSLTFMGAGAQIVSGDGTIDKLALFRAIGILPGPSSPTINNIYGFKVDSVLTAANPVNAWGLFVDAPDAENFMSKLAIGTSTKKVDIGVALDVVGAIQSDTSLILQDPGVGVLAVTITAPTLAAPYTFILPTDMGTTGQVLTTDGTSATWENADPGFDPTDITSDLIPDADAMYDIGTAVLQWNNVYSLSTVTNSVGSQSGSALGLYSGTGVIALDSSTTNISVATDDAVELADATNRLSNVWTHLLNGVDPSTFTINGITALTGDAMATGPGSAALTLATVNANPGTHGSASQTVVFTANAKGLITAATDTSIAVAASAIVSGTLATARGGTNLDTSGSTGLAKVASGTWSVAALVDADVSSTAAIAATKLAPFAYRTVTTTATIAASDESILAANSSAYTVTLPTAVGASGKIYNIAAIGTSISNFISIGTTSGQTVGGRASLNIKLRRTGDFVQAISDGANWQIIAIYETIQAVFKSTAGNNITSSFADVAFATAVEDTTNSNFSGTVFTADVPGMYQVSYGFRVPTPGAAAIVSTQVLFNSSVVAATGYSAQATGEAANIVGTAHNIRLNGTSDTIKVQAKNTGGTAAYDAAAGTMFIDIIRTGN